MSSRTRRADSLSDATIKATPFIRIDPDTPMQLVGDWPNADGTHTLIVRVAAAAAVEIRPGGSDA